MSFKVPDSTSINPQEYVPDKNTIAFAPELISFITEKKKVTTYRFGLKYDYLQVGDTVAIENSETHETVARAVISGKSRTTFVDIPVETAIHESYRDKEHQREVLSGYYAYLGRPIDDGDTCLIFDFNLV